MSTHTPGPWTAIHDGGHDDGENWYVVRQNEEPLGLGLSEANACLIAAAPDLLAALKAMVLNDTHTYRDCHKAARAAIAKAEGTS